LGRSTWGIVSLIVTLMPPIDIQEGLLIMMELLHDGKLVDYGLVVSEEE
jgi:hypothetical protein